MKKIFRNALSAILVSATAATAQPTNGLQLYYNFDDRFATDQSGNGNSGTPLSLDWGRDEVGNLPSTAIFNSSLGSHISLPEDLLNQQEITVSLWFKTNSTGCILGYQDNFLGGSIGQFVPAIYITNFGTLSTTFWASATSSINNNGVTYNDNEWHHVVLAGDAAGQDVYIDGTLVNSTTSGIVTLANASFAQLGSGYAHGNWSAGSSSASPFSFEGAIDEVRIYHRRVNATEAQQLFDATPTPIGLLAHYNLTNANGTDDSFNNNNVTMNNAAATFDRDGNAYSAAYFNGTNNSSGTTIDLYDDMLNNPATTISLWFKTNSQGCLVGMQNTEMYGSPTSNVPMVYFGSDGELYAGLWQGNGPENNNINTSTTNFNDNQWHHLVLTGDENEQHLYVDNVHCGSGSGIAVLNSHTYATNIGTGYGTTAWPAWNTGWRNFKGSMDDIRIYNVRIGAAEVSDLFYGTTPDVVYIPDAALKADLLANLSINTNNDTEIQYSEAEAFTSSLIINNSMVSDLTGVEAFISATNLEITGVQATSLDLPASTELIGLNISNTQIASIDLNDAPQLLYLGIYDSPVASVNLSSLSQLIQVQLRNLPLTSLSLTNNTNITLLRLQNLPISLLDLSQNTLVDDLKLTELNISNLDLTHNTALVDVQLADLNIPSLNLTFNTDLESLEIESCTITSIQLGNLPNLTDIEIGTTLLNPTLDVSGCAALEYIYITDSQLEYLDLSNNPQLYSIYLASNNLEELNVANGNNAAIQFFNTTNNPDLTCIQVDDANYSTNTWLVSTGNIAAGGAQYEFDSQHTFSENCALTTAIEPEVLEADINVFPNPVVDMLNITTNTSSNISYTVFDAMGRMVMYGTTDNRIDMGALPTGVYRLQLQRDEHLNTVSVVKQ